MLPAIMLTEGWYCAGSSGGQSLSQFPAGRAHHEGVCLFPHLLPPPATHPPPPHVASLGYGRRDVPAAASQVRMLYHATNCCICRVASHITSRACGTTWAGTTDHHLLLVQPFTVFNSSQYNASSLAAFYGNSDANLCTSFILRPCAHLTGFVCAIVAAYWRTRSWSSNPALSSMSN